MAASVISFRYFEAPESEMIGLLREVERCGICGTEGRCFDLQRALVPSSVAASAGCLACLKAGRFGFFHITEIGYLDEGGLTWYGDEEPDVSARAFIVDSNGTAAPVPTTIDSSARVTVKSEAVDELRRTPAFPTWNEVAWLVHCSDFMVYLGTWQPPDVRAAAAARHQRACELFTEMTDTAGDGIWSDDGQEWSFAFHAFRCDSCSALRGAIDVD